MVSRFEILNKVPYLMIGDVTFASDGTICLNSNDYLVDLIYNLAHVFGPRAIEVKGNNVYIMFGGQFLTLDMENGTWEIEEEI